MDLARHDRQVQLGLEHQERRDRDRQPDEEGAAPAEGRVDDQAADERAGDGGQRECRSDVARVAAALARADHRGDDHLHQGGQAADPEPLDHAGADQHLHVRRERRDQRPDRVDHQRGLDEQLLAEQVGELAPDRGGRGHREQRRHDDPGVAGLAAVQVGDDPRQRVGHHGARQHRDEHREQQPGQCLEHLAVRHLTGRLDRGLVEGGGGSGGGAGPGHWVLSVDAEHEIIRLPWSTVFRTVDVVNQ